MIFRRHRERGPPLHLRALGWLFPRRQLVLIKLFKHSDGWSTHVEMLVHEGDTADVMANAIEAMSIALQQVDPERVEVQMVDDFPTGSKWGHR